jgi:acetylornithine deacetylase/succinyl-diaminopimelate desuccinylase-like protein
VREAAPAGAEVSVELLASADPGLVPPDSQALTLAADAFEAVVGTRPLLIRSGGSIPLVPALSARGIPVVCTGFALNESNVHSPNERLRAEYLPLGVAAAEEVLRRLGGLR